MNNGRSLTQALVPLIREKEVSGEDLQRASIYALDAVANAIAGRNTEPGRILLDWRTSQGDDPGRRAFVMGGLTHILETDDLHRSSVTHPGCVVVPAVLATASIRPVSGVRLLTAVLQGFEAMCRVGNAVGPTHYIVWHNTATCGPFGSAMSTASLLDLDDEQTTHALGNAGTQSSGLWQFLETGAMSKHLHAGRAAESGVVAATLAELGFTGPPAILEGDKGFFRGACPDATPDAVLADPHAPWELTRTSIKPWPSCRHTHPAIDAALALHSRLAGRNVESVKVDTYQAALDVCDRPDPTDLYSAKFSLYHTVAAALEDGEIRFDSFDEAARARLGSARGKVSIAASEPFASAYPEHWGAQLTVHTADGEELVETREGARGDPKLALDDAEMKAKAAMLLDHAGLDSSTADRVIESVLGLPNDPDGSAVARAITAIALD